MKKIIKTSEMVFTCGMTGSGKTFAMKQYLKGYANAIVLDLKGTFEFEDLDVPIFDKLKDLESFGKGKAIYRPCFQELNKEYYEKFFEWVYFRQNTICYIDEIMALSDNPTYIPIYAKAILTRGRERNTAIWGATQRPKTIPLVYMSEATHLFIFRLNLEADKKRVMEIIPYDEIMQNIEKRQFWYYNIEMDKPVLSKLVERKGA